MKKLIPSEAHIVLGVTLPGRRIIMDKKKEKKIILVDDPEQRHKNIIEWVRKFWEEHQDLMRSLAGLDDEYWEEPSKDEQSVTTTEENKKDD